MTREEAEQIHWRQRRKRQRQVETEGFDGPWQKVETIEALMAQPSRRRKPTLSDVLRSLGVKR